MEDHDISRNNRVCIRRDRTSIRIDLRAQKLVCEKLKRGNVDVDTKLAKGFGVTTL
jgi:hypothetical protein